MDNVDKNIQQAFDNWDNMPNNISYNKQAVWNNISKKKTAVIPLFLKVAAIAVILLLSGALTYSIYWNNTQQNNYNQQIIALQQKLNIKPKKIIEKQIEVKYKTKEVFVISPKQQKQIVSLQQELNKLQQQNKKLQNSLQNIVLRTKILTDSVKYWNNTAKRLQIYYQQEIATLKSQNDSGITFNIDKKNLMAMQEDNTPTEHRQRGKGFFKVKFGSDNRATPEKGTSKSIFEIRR